MTDPAARAIEALDASARHCPRFLRSVFLARAALVLLTARLGLRVLRRAI